MMNIYCQIFFNENWLDRSIHMFVYRDIFFTFNLWESHCQKYFHFLVKICLFTDVIIRSDSALNKDMKRLHTFIGYLAKAGWTKKIIHFDSFFRIYAIKKKRGTKILLQNSLVKDRQSRSVWWKSAKAKRGYFELIGNKGERNEIMK